MLFPKIGIEATKGLIPGVNFIEMCKAVGRPSWHAALLLVPILNLFIFAAMCVEMVRSFGKYGLGHSALAVFYPPAIFASIAKDNKTKYIEPNLSAENDYKAQILEAKKEGKERQYKKLVENNPYKKTVIREWVESIFFAVFAAAFIRMFLIEAYVIPTPSMEGSLNVGDYLFVSKAHYGIRMPMTVAMIPLLHNRIPMTDSESYFSKPSLPYKRLPAFNDIERNDPIVFNWPVGDSVYITKQRSYTVGQLERQPEFMNQDRALRNLVKNKKYVVRPLDKKDHYIKRGVGIAGDSLEIRNREIFINGKKSPESQNTQFVHDVFIPNSVNFGKLDEWGIDIEYAKETQHARSGNGGVNAVLYLSNNQVEKLKSLGSNIIVKVRENKAEPKKLFPHSPQYYPDWSVDNYGPVWIPKAGETIELTPENIVMYQRCIAVYENNNLEIKGGKAFIDGKEASSYTFKQDYYWAMGDNRHNSEDSRMWGFVPHDHIVGKPLFIWFSTKYGSMSRGINWDRIFTSAHKM